MTTLESIDRARRYAYRFAKYQLLRPRAPQLENLLGGRTVVVVGSAPSSSRPEGWTADFRVLSINASQIAAGDWLAETPDVTLMQFNQIEGENNSAREVRRVLHGKETGCLIVLHWRHSLHRLKDGLSKFSYAYDNLQIMGRYERIELMRQVTGRLNLELEAGTKWSNGIVGVALALHSNATKVILSGIDPLSTGHAYNEMNHARLHTASDMEAISILMQRNYPIYTADKKVSRECGIPLWQG